MAERTCSIEGCTGKLLARGWCTKHYQRWRIHGDPLYAPPGIERREQYLASKGAATPALFCSVPGCTRPADVPLYGWCSMHHARWLRTGDVQAHRPCRDDRRTDGWLWCSQCETHKEPDDFYRNSTTKTGRDGVCKTCTRERWERQRVHRAIVAHAYRERNREKINARKREAYHRNPKQSNEAGAAWRKANPDKARLQIRAQNAARYAKNKSAPGRATPQQIEARWAYYGSKCWMCGAEATDTDHVKPLVAGGSNWPANLRPACRKCNRAKGAKWPWAPLRAALEVARARRAAHGQAA